METYFLKDV